MKRGNEPRFQPYVAKALARLVDVSFRTGDVASLDEVFANLNLVPPAQVDAALTYAKGKAYYAKKDYGNAQAHSRTSRTARRTRTKRGISRASSR